MRLLAFDLETTGLDADTCQVLQMAACCFESDTGTILGEFEVACSHEVYRGDAFSLVMNNNLLKRIDAHSRLKTQARTISRNGDVLPIDRAWLGMRTFIRKWFPAGDATAVGFNVGSFDLAFANKKMEDNPFSHRTIEMGTLLMGMLGQSTPVPSDEAFKFFKLGPVPHDAIADCKGTVKIYTAWANAMRKREIQKEQAAINAQKVLEFESIKKSQLHSAYGGDRVAPKSSAGLQTIQDYRQELEHQHKRVRRTEYMLSELVSEYRAEPIPVQAQMVVKKAIAFLKGGPV